MYKVQVLASRDFDALPAKVTRGSDISDSMGFADPVTNTAYVRNTIWDELNKYLIDHELEHLIEKNKTHVDDNGICHKKGPKFFKDIIMPAITGGLSGIGGGPGGAILGAGMGAMNGIQGAQNRVQQNSQPGGGIPQMGGGFSSLFAPTATAPFSGGGNQFGASTPAGMGPSGQSSIGLFQPGLGQAGIGMGGQSMNQSGYYFPQRDLMKF